jgi:hypothetical protein
MAAVEQLVTSRPELVSDLPGLAVALGAALPRSIVARVSVRSATPKQTPATAADPTWPLRHLRHTLLIVTTGESGSHCHLLCL